MMRTTPLLNRFLGTAALAGVIGGLLASYQWGHAAGPSLVPVTPASAEMMQLLRDEHGLVATMISTRLETERKKLAAREADRSGTAGPHRAAIAR